MTSDGGRSEDAASLVDAFADFIGSVPYREVELPFGTAQVWDAGEGPPVVLIHGIASGRRVFFRAVPRIARTHRVVVPPLRGHDIADRTMTHEHLLDDVEVLLDALGLEDVTLVGTSFGGTIALAYGARRDPRVSAVVVQGTFLGFRLRGLDRVVLNLARLVPPRLGSRYFAWRVSRGPEVRVVARCAPELVPLVVDWSAKTPFPSLVRRARMIARMDLSPQVRSIDVPLTIAHGALDRVVPPRFFDRLRAVRDDARVVWWEDIGHLAPLTHPQRYADLIAGARAPVPPAR